MTNRFRTALVWLAAVAVLASVATPAIALTKEEMHDEMIAIAAQISAIKGNAAAVSQVRQLQGRYDQLSAALGGDDPGSILDHRMQQAAPFTAPPAPPNCAIDTGGTFTRVINAPIDDSTPVTDMQAVAGIGTFIYDVDVVVNITHTFASDLEFEVTSPGGTTVTLSTDNGGGNDDVFVNTVFDDDAGDANAPGPVNDVTYATGVPEPTVAPEEPLAAFIGEDPNGTWTFDAVDDAGGDSGTVVSWELVITTLTAAPILDAPVNNSNAPGLPFDDSTPVQDSFAIASPGTFICGVELTTDITHTFASDIEMFLTSPAGTVATVSSDNGGGNDDVYAGTTWEDNAGDTNPPGGVNDVTYANGVAETPIASEEGFGAFIGEDPNGTWTMDVTDDAGGDSGTFNSWALDVTTCSCVLPDSDLAVSKTGNLTGLTEVTWTIGVQNNGPDDATGVVVTDALDGCSTYVSDDCGGMNIPPWTWNVGNLPNGAVSFCNVVVDISGCGGSVSNTAMASGDQNDPVPGNNAAVADVAASPVVIPTLGTIGLALLAAVLAFGALFLLRRRASV